MQVACSESVPLTAGADRKGLDGPLVPDLAFACLSPDANVELRVIRNGQGCLRILVFHVSAPVRSFGSLEPAPASLKTSYIASRRGRETLTYPGRETVGEAGRKSAWGENI